MKYKEKQRFINVYSNGLYVKLKMYYNINRERERNGKRLVSTYDIARALDMPQKRVWYWLKKFNE